MRLAVLLMTGRLRRTRAVLPHRANMSADYYEQSNESWVLCKKRDEVTMRLVHRSVVFINAHGIAGYESCSTSQSASVISFQKS